MKKIACVVLPTYNEAENVKVLLPKIFEQQELLKSHELHVLVVDDNSPDGTSTIVKNEQSKNQYLHLLSGEKHGLGEAYKRGMNYAIKKLEADVLIQMDADFQHDPSVINLFLTLNSFGFTLVIGSRFLPGASIVNFSLYRKLISLFGNFLIRFLGGLPRLRDFTSGYRCIESSLVERCDLKKLSTRGYSFQTSLLFELIRNGAKVLEIPIVFSERIFGESKLTFRDKFEFLVNLIKIRFGRFYDFIRYLIIGFSGLIVNMGLFILLTRFINLTMGISAFIAIECSILCNFFLNNLWGFKGSNFTFIYKKIANFHKLTLPGAIVNILVLYLLVHLFNFNDLFANFVGIGFGVIMNYGVIAYLSWNQKYKYR